MTRMGHVQPYRWKNCMNMGVLILCWKLEVRLMTKSISEKEKMIPVDVTTDGLLSDKNILRGYL